CLGGASEGFRRAEVPGVPVLPRATGDAPPPRSRQICSRRRHDQAEGGFRSRRFLVWRSDLASSAMLKRLPLRHIAERDRPALRRPTIDAGALPIADTGRLAPGNAQSVPCGERLPGHAGTPPGKADTCLSDKTADPAYI